MDFICRTGFGNKAKKYRNTMRDVDPESVAIGQDAVKTARMLQQYVRRGAMTLARDYPEMMKRMKGRIPGNISYEALRLARTEMTAAFGEGTIAASRSCSQLHRDEMGVER